MKDVPHGQVRQVLFPSPSTGLHRRAWLSPASNHFLLATMERCITGKRRIPGMLPEGARIAHTGEVLGDAAINMSFALTVREIPSP